MWFRLHGQPLRRTTRWWRSASARGSTCPATQPQSRPARAGNAWLGYERDWLATSRGTDPADLAAGWASLEAKHLVAGGEVTSKGVAMRQRIEGDTDRLTTLPWQLLGPAESARFAEDFEPPCEALLARVDVTAGPNYQPGSRVREPR